MILPSRNLSSTNAIVSLVINDTDASSFADDIRFSGWSVTPEIRIYPFKSDMDLHGFYVAPALRASRYAVKTDYSYTTSSGELNTLTAKGSLTGFGANVIIGITSR